MERGDENFGEQERFEQEQWNIISSFSDCLKSFNKAQVDETYHAIKVLYETYRNL